MQTLEKLLCSRAINILFNVLLSILFIVFASAHIDAFIKTGDFTLLIFCASASLSALFSFFRTIPKSVSTDPFDWLIAFGGTMTPLFLRPAEDSLWVHGNTIIIAAVLLQMAALLSLNRSVAIVPANRRIKTGGLYRCIRHPMYASYFFLLLGYLLAHTTLMNAGLIALTCLFTFLRMNAEEKLLSADGHYREYQKRVRWKLMPFLY